MEDFPFDFILSYKDEEYKVKPPPNLFKLKELASKKFEIEIEEMLYILENDEKMIINNEQHYLDLIQYVSAHALSEIIIYINKEKDEDEVNEEDKEGENEEKEEEKEEKKKEEKNMKGKYKGKNKKHNKGVKEQKRIGYIIEKKQMQRDETLKEEEEKKQKKNK